jgi:hypothetical protein
MENLDLYKLVIEHSTVIDNYLVEKKFISRKSVEKISGWILKLIYERPDNLVRIYMVFGGTNYAGFSVNGFEISIDQPKLKQSLGIGLDKFVQKHPDLGSIEMFSLNYYTGTIEEKIRSCFEFILKVLSHPELLRVYEGDYYTNEYYKPWYEGNNLD